MLFVALLHQGPVRALAPSESAHLAKVKIWSVSLSWPLFLDQLFLVAGVTMCTANLVGSCTPTKPPDGNATMRCSPSHECRALFGSPVPNSPTDSGSTQVCDSEQTDSESTQVCDSVDVDLNHH